MHRSMRQMQMCHVPGPNPCPSLLESSTIAPPPDLRIPASNLEILTKRGYVLMTNPSLDGGDTGSGGDAVVEMDIQRAL